MKTSILMVLFILFSSFAYAEDVTPTPKKIIPITLEKGMTVWQVYNQNRNYRPTHKNTDAFTSEFCVNNPEPFKKLGCTEKAFRLLRADKIYFFPTLPETGRNKSTKWAYNHNQVLKSGFVNDSCRQESKKPRLFQVCAIKALEQLKNTKNPKIIQLPETYIIPGVTQDMITITEKGVVNKFEKSKNGEYYNLTETKTEQTSQLTLKAATESLGGDVNNDNHPNQPGAYIEGLKQK